MLPGDPPNLRKARGAFFTPSPIARFIVDWAVRSADDAVLEPAIVDRPLKSGLRAFPRVGNGTERAGSIPSIRSGGRGDFEMDASERKTQAAGQVVAPSQQIANAEDEMVSALRETADKDSAADSGPIAPDPSPELGILLVHGIGSQSQGSTLIKWVDAFARSLPGARTDEITRYLGSGSKNVAVSSARLHPIEDEPATATLDSPGSDGRGRCWLFAEAFWQRELLPPTYGSLVGWTIRVLPMAITLHASGQIRRVRARMSMGPALVRAWQRISLILWIGVLFPILSLAAPLIAAFSLLLLLVGLLPVAALRSTIRRIQRGLTGAVGDAMILLDSPTQGAAMTSRVADGVAYLREQGCTRIAVLAHSQGAAIAKETLTTAPEITIDALVTVGSGLNKLEGLRRRGERASSFWFPMIYLLVAVVLSFFVVSELRQGDLELIPLLLAIAGAGISMGLVMSGWFWSLARYKNFPPWVSAGLFMLVLCLLIFGVIFLAPERYLLPAGLGFFLYWVILVSVSQSRGVDGVLDENLRDQTANWLDLYSKYDPVPNGETRTRVLDWPTSIEVRNLDSFVWDHNRYAQASDDCVAAICEFFETLGLPDTHPYVRSARVRMLAGHRRWRIFQLRVGRWLLGLVALYALAELRHNLSSFGKEVYAGAVGNVPGLNEVLPTTAGTEWGMLVALTSAGLAWFVCSRILVLLWEAWDSRASTRDTSGEDIDGPSMHQLILMYYPVLVLYLLALLIPGLGVPLPDLGLWRMVVALAFVLGPALLAMSLASKRVRSILAKPPQV